VSVPESTSLKLFVSPFTPKGMKRKMSFFTGPFPCPKRENACFSRMLRGMTVLKPS
jgi:hypothetical protein